MRNIWWFWESWHTALSCHQVTVEAHGWGLDLAPSQGKGSTNLKKKAGHWVRRSEGGRQTALVPAQLPLPVWRRTGQLSAVWRACPVTETRQFQYANRDVHTRQFSSDRAPWTLTDQQRYTGSSPSVPSALKREGSSLADPLWKKG